MHLCWNMKLWSLPDTDDSSNTCHCTISNVGHYTILNVGHCKSSNTGDCTISNIGHSANACQPVFTCRLSVG